MLLLGNISLIKIKRVIRFEAVKVALVKNKLLFLSNLGGFTIKVTR